MLGLRARCQTRFVTAPLKTYGPSLSELMLIFSGAHAPLQVSWLFSA